MLRLRQYRKCDAEAIASWLTDRRVFRMWSADRYDRFPVTGEDIIAYYERFEYADNFYEFTAFDGSGAVGHMIMRFTDEEKQNLHFGFVIVDAARRGRGYGTEMLRLAIRYAFEILRVSRITLGVYSENAGAIRCYEALGFRFTGEEEPCEIDGGTWVFREMELLPPTGVRA